MTSVPATPHDNSPSAPAEPTRVKDLPAVDAQIDYERYRRPQLREAIESLLSISGALRVFGLTLVVVFPCVWLGLTLLFVGRDWWVLGGAAVCAVIMAGLISLLLAALLVARKVLQDTVQILDETFDIVRTIVKDIGSAHEQGPIGTTAAVFRGVNQHIALPIVEAVVQARLGWFARPVLWIYRGVFLRTLDAATQTMLNAASKIQVPGGEYVALAANSINGGVSHTAVSLDWWLDALHPYVNSGTRAIRLIVLAPLAVSLAVITLLLFAMTMAAWWWV